MTQPEFLADLSGHLEASGIPFMIAGSIASSFHGQPRATNDIDLVIDPTAAQLDDLLSRIQDRYYVSAQAAREALKSRSMFNVLLMSAGLKADLIIRKDRGFSIQEFERRSLDQLQNRALPIASAEDVILTKLEWNRITPSERQIRDALNVAITQWPTLDQAYLRKWAPELGITEDMEELLTAAQQAQGPP